LKWGDESEREAAREEKHERGAAARVIRDHRRSEDARFSLKRKESVAKVIEAPTQFPSTYAERRDFVKKLRLDGPIKNNDTGWELNIPPRLGNFPSWVINAGFYR
jgi:hypothetical protein